MRTLVILSCLGFLVHYTYAQPSIQTITITFNQAPVSAKSNFAPAKYNKDAVFQLEFDDRVGQFRDVYAYMNGGPASDGVLYPGKNYTDGCGNAVNFRAGLSCNAYSNGTLADVQYSGTYITWPEIRNYLSKGWLPMNHGLRHNVTDAGWPGYLNNIAFMNQYIRDSTGGFSCRVWVSPNADEGYLAPAQSLHYLASTSQSARDGYPAFPPYDWYKYTTIESLPTGFTQFTRNYNWDWSPASVSANLYPLIDALVSGNSLTNHKVMRLFSHGEVWSLDGFKMFTDYLQGKANDRVWICSLQEFAEYEEMKRKVIKSELLENNKLTITLDRSQLPETAHFQDLSLLVNAGNEVITDVSVTGADGFSYNASGLINIFNRKKYGSNATANQLPSANAGNDQGITLPTSSVTLSGSGSDGDGTISSYSWSKVSGGNISFSAPSSPSTTVSGLTQGNYNFRLTVTDNSGATATDEVGVVVNAASNQPPMVGAGSNQTILLPTNTVTLSGTASDADGSVTGYSWTNQSGGSATIASPSGSSTTVSGLVQGVYVFRLTVSDNGGATAFSEVTVTVNAAPQENLLKMTPPADLTVYNDSLKCSAANVVLGQPVISSSAGIKNLLNNAPATYPVGTTVVTWTATDVNGSSVSSIQNVTVRDMEKPRVTCPVTAALCYNPTNIYTVSPLSVTDNCGIGSVVYTISGATSRTGTDRDASGLFNPGSSVIKWTVTDVHGNSNFCQSSIVVGTGVNVMVPDALAIAKGVDPNTVYIGYAPASSIKLSAQASGGNGNYSYLWSNGARTASITVSPLVTTTYSVVVKDGSGCASPSVSKTIKTVDIRCGAKNDMATICANGKTTCVKSNNLNAQLNNGAYLGACKTASSLSTREARSTITEVPPMTLTLSCLPNPSVSFFTIKASGLNGAPARLHILNSLGSLVDTKNISADQTFYIGSAYRPGIYYLELIQEEKRIIRKLVKLK
jgi:hypothetical protein